MEHLWLLSTRHNLLSRNIYLQTISNMDRDFAVSWDEQSVAGRS